MNKQNKQVDLEPPIREAVLQLLKDKLSISTDIDWEYDTKILTTRLFFDGKEISRDQVILGHDDF